MSQPEELSNHDVSYAYASDRAEYERQTFDDFKGDALGDLFRVIGDRRSVRYFKPYRRVERWKVEMIFQAAHRSSRAINGSFIKAVAVERDEMDIATREALKTPTNTSDLEMAPLYIFTYANMQAALGGPPRLKDLYDRGAFAPAIGWSHEFADAVIGETILKPMAGDDEAAIWIGSVEAAQAIAHMLLAITALGLGACCKSFVPDAIKDSVKVPDHFYPVWMILVGYPAEDGDAGGQRPRPPLEQDYFFGDFESPFTTTEHVTDELRRRRLLQRVAPTPWRADEVRYIARSLGLPEE
jgi:nitroreductase